MTAENFCYWLQGYLEITGKGAVLSPDQVKMISDHLGYVFNKPAQMPTPPAFDMDKYSRQLRDDLQQRIEISPWTPPLTVTC